VVDDFDRFVLLALIDSIGSQYGWQIAAHCLMDNHYHLVMEIGERGMSDGFCRLNTAYATRFNKRHGRVNHLFGARYGSKPLRTQASVVNTCRYVVLNPVRARVVERPEIYRWSSYRATIGVAEPDIALSTTELLTAFSRDLRRARIAFADFVSTPTLAEKAVAASVTSV
jgi:putative transposase